jgi:hypothetical protein
MIRTTCLQSAGRAGRAGRIPTLQEWSGERSPQTACCRDEIYSAPQRAGRSGSLARTEPAGQVSAVRSRRSRKIFGTSRRGSRSPGPAKYGGTMLTLSGYPVNGRRSDEWPRRFAIRGFTLAIFRLSGAECFRESACKFHRHRTPC